MAVRVTCINKDGGYHENPYTAITYLGWVKDSGGETGKSTRLEMYDFVKGGGEAYVQVGAARAVLIAAITPGGTKYVKTQADSTTKDNLLKLPEC